MQLAAHNQVRHWCYGLFMFRLSTIIIALVTSQQLLAEVEVECGDINIGSMGLSWSKIDGKLFTGTLVCLSDSKETRTPYLKGYKQGTEVSTWTDIDFDEEMKEEKHYKKGVAVESCITSGIGDFYQKECREIDCAVEECR